MFPESSAVVIEENDIPKQYRILQPIKQNYYLIEGELRIWEGPLQKVHSPVRIPGA